MTASAEARLVDQRVAEPQDLSDARERHRWRIPEAYAIAEDALFAQPADAVAALVSGDDGIDTVTFGELQGRASRFAGALRQLGVNRGDRVAVALAPSPEAAAVVFAVLATGSVLVPLPRLLGGEAMAYRIRHSGARLLVTDEQIRDRIEGLTEVPVLTSLPDADPVTPVRTSAADPALIVYTSGTTGRPKGIVHAQRMLLGHAGVDYAFDLYRSGDVYYGTADWGWVGGLLLGLLVPWAHGVPIVAQRADAFDPQAVVDLWEAAGVTIAFLPPTALRALRAAGVRPTQQLRVVVTGGEMAKPDELAWARQELAPIVNKAYGLTEANGLIGDSTVLGTSDDDSAGAAYPGHEITVRGELGQVVANGEVGELCLQLPDPVALVGYWDDDEGFAARVAGGYLRTGDLGQQQSDGRFRYLGRADDVIKSGGYRIGPAEIETALTAHPDVSEAVAVGVPDAARGQRVKAYLRLESGTEGTEALFAALSRLVRTSVGPHAAPREYSVVVDFPRTETGKVKRREMVDTGMPE